MVDGAKSRLSPIVSGGVAVMLVMVAMTFPGLSSFDRVAHFELAFTAPAELSVSDFTHLGTELAFNVPAATG